MSHSVQWQRNDCAASAALSDLKPKPRVVSQVSHVKTVSTSPFPHWHTSLLKSRDSRHSAAPLTLPGPFVLRSEGLLQSREGVHAKITAWMCPHLNLLQTHWERGRYSCQGLDDLTFLWADETKLQDDCFSWTQCSLYKVLNPFLTCESNVLAALKCINSVQTRLCLESFSNSEKNGLTGIRTVAHSCREQLYSQSQNFFTL